jgi:oligoendopeptidase F
MPPLDRSQIPDGTTWDLGPLYTGIHEWTGEFRQLEKAAAELSSFRGTLCESALNINQAFRCYLEISRVLERLYVFAHLQSDVDTANSENLGYLETATNLHARIAALSSYLVPELLAIDAERLNQFLEYPELTDLRRMLLDVVRYKPHTLSKEEENVLALATEVLGTSSKVFSQLNNADMSFPDVEADGNNEPLSHASYTLFLKKQNREVRERAFTIYYKEFDEHKNTIAATLTGSIKKDVYLANVRHYNSALEQALFGDNVSEDVYHNLIDTVSRGLAPLHRYYELRAARLGLKPLRIYDTYVPLVADVTAHHTYEEAVELITEALVPLGEHYVGALHDGLTAKRWVDRYENKGKKSGAYSSGCFDSYPYILLNYKDTDISSVFTLAHEAGHSLHSYYSQRNQPYQDYRYTIFVAEVASTFNEQLLLKKLKERYADNPRMLAYLLNEQIEDIKGTFYRQVMFAEFERTVHQLAEKNSPLTIAVYREVYRELLHKYFGPAVALSELDELECLRIPHFYSAFYVYKYATGLSASISLAEQVLSGNAQSCERYLDFLKGGCSKYPVELLYDAGVDITSPEPIEATIRLFNSLLDEFEAVTG